jgi:hypothetical protein
LSAPKKRLGAAGREPHRLFAMVVKHLPFFVALSASIQRAVKRTYCAGWRFFFLPISLP